MRRYALRYILAGLVGTMIALAALPSGTQAQPVYVPGGYRYYGYYAVSPYWGVNAVANLTHARANLTYAAADIIRSKGEYLVLQQKAIQMQDENIRRRLETRKKVFQQIRWERDFKLQLWAEAREINREIRTIKAEDPGPLMEYKVRDGVALNALLDHLSRRTLSESESRDLPADILKHININILGGSASLLREGKFHWPTLLQEDTFDDDRQELEKLLAKARAEAKKGEGKIATIKGMYDTIGRMEGTLDSMLRREGAGSGWVWRGAIPARRRINELKDNLKLLEDPETAARILGRPLVAKNVSQLVHLMHSNGYRFAPASLTGGDGIRAYRLLHQAMAADSERARKASPSSLLAPLNTNR